MVNERTVIFACGQDKLLGILHRPAATSPRCAMVLVVGGPQYRAGSHRQFVLLSRALADSGVAVFRFDYRGMGDSTGKYAGFQGIEDDLRCAIDTTLANVPEVDSVALWGLCDAASAIAMYAGVDARVQRIVLVNPWVRSAAGAAEVIVRTYYRERLFDHRAWKQLLLQPGKWLSAIISVGGNLQRAFLTGGAKAKGTVKTGSYGLPDTALPERVFLGLQRYQGLTGIIVCEKDLTGQEFQQAARSRAEYEGILGRPNVVKSVISGADHTFSRSVWRDEVVDLTREWLLQ